MTERLTIEEVTREAVSLKDQIRKEMHGANPLLRYLERNAPERPKAPPMKVASVEQVSWQLVKFEDGTEYVRQGPDDWMIGYGESWESLYACDAAEAAYRAFAAAATAAD